MGVGSRGAQGRLFGAIRDAAWYSQKTSYPSSCVGSFSTGRGSRSSLENSRINLPHKASLQSFRSFDTVCKFESPDSCCLPLLRFDARLEGRSSANSILSRGPSHGFPRPCTATSMMRLWCASWASMTMYHSHFCPRASVYQSFWMSFLSMSLTHACYMRVLSRLTWTSTA